MAEAVLVRQDGRNVYANPAAARLLGAAGPQDLVGKELFSIVEPAHRERDEGQMRRVLAGEELAPFEDRFVRADGSVVLVESAVSLLTWQGRPALYVVVRDITERKQAEAKLQASLAEKEVLMREVHHRVKNNLQMMSALLELQARDVKDANAQAYFRDSQQRIQSMAMIHAQLYRNEDLAQVDFARYLQGLVDNLRGQYGERCKQVDVQVDAKACILPVDIAVPLGLAVTELVSNAMKHAFPDGRSGELRIRLRCDDERKVVLEVSDDGVGLPAGQDWRESQEFRPAVACPDGRATAARQAHLEVRSRHERCVRNWSAKMNEKIFVVEDDALTAAQLRGYIDEMGYRFAGKTDNAEDALDEIRKSEPDLVLMDIRLNGAMDGIEAAARLRAEATAALIFLTAYADDETLARAKLTEPYGYLVKPFNKQNLQAAIEMGLYKSAMERKQQRIHDAMAQTVTELVKLHDPFIDNVQSRAAALAEAIAVELQLPRAEVQGIRLAALLHGIGLVGIPGALIAFEAPLQGAQKALFQTHPEIAWNLLKGLEFSHPVAETVFQHMERLDGSGFPRGLSGADILPGARIVAVACMVAKMLSPWGREAPAGVEKAIEALGEGRGTQFDAEVVDACLKLLSEQGSAILA